MTSESEEEEEEEEQVQEDYNRDDVIIEPSGRNESDSGNDNLMTIFRDGGKRPRHKIPNETKALT